MVTCRLIALLALAAAPVPATTGATAFGSVRGRAPSIHCLTLATSPIVACCDNVAEART